MSPDTKQRRDALCMLAIDAIEKAKSGHPGMPLGMADIAETLWHRFLRHDPQNPTWINRDRFVLSNGHGSMLLYALLHLTGYDLSIDELKAFRQLHSKTPGHPEWGETPGVESTSGPLGQGLAHAVGMALAEKRLSAEFNRPDFTIIDHFTYAFVGDGCLMEGVSHEVASLAGTWGLGKLIVIWDDNGISIDGPTDAWLKENTPDRFAAYGWQVITADGHDPDAIAQAIEQGQGEANKPTLIAARTRIGKDSLHEGSAACHGSPLGDEGIKALRETLNWSHPPFVIPEDIYASWQDNPRLSSDAWKKCFSGYQSQYPELAKELMRRGQGKLPENWSQIAKTMMEKAVTHKDALATRKASLWCLNELVPNLPELMGGSADLTPSNLTQATSAKAWPEDPVGNYLHFGVREFGMFAILNGMALHGGFIPFGGTFLVFSDYARSAIRMAALMKTKVVFVLTHDSIGLGEDGPTHQPVEHLAMLRATPNLAVWRPASLRETLIAWQQALTHDGPSCLILSRQSLPVFRAPLDTYSVENGAEALLAPNHPVAQIIATGSEVPLALSAAKTLEGRGHAIRVVSMPCMERFKTQSTKERDQILPPKLRDKTVVIEAAASQPWFQWISPPSRIIGVDAFGGSAPKDDLYQAFGITHDCVVDAILSLIGDRHDT